MRNDMMKMISAILLLTVACSAKLTGYKKRNFDTISKIYELTQYPNNLAFIANGSASVPPGLFNEKAQGRITPVGNFSQHSTSLRRGFRLTSHSWIRRLNRILLRSRSYPDAAVLSRLLRCPCGGIYLWLSNGGVLGRVLQDHSLQSQRNK